MNRTGTDTEKRNRIVFNTVVAIILLGSLVYVATYMRGVDLVFSEVVLDLQGLAEHMNIENMVAVVYLGPRIFDTFLEVNVVVLTVFGMKFIRSTS